MLSERQRVVLSAVITAYVCAMSLEGESEEETQAERHAGVRPVVGSSH